MNQSDLPTEAKPHAPATERNRDSIADVLQEHFADRQRVLEIGSGTGQHAVYFARRFPHLIWQTSDRPEYLGGINAWLHDAQLANTPAVLQLDVNGTWPSGQFDAVFSANTLHIMSWSDVERLFAGLPGILTDDARLVIYGAFNYGGHYTSETVGVQALGEHLANRFNLSFRFVDLPTGV